MGRLGAEGGAGVSFGSAAGLAHGSSAVNTLQDGTVALVDGGCNIDEYPSDISRSIVFGQASEKAIKVWETVRQAQLAAIKAVKPGVACQEIDRVARKVIADAGFGSGYQYFVHRLGHGLGLDGHDGTCHLVAGNTRPMAAGMMFTIEPGLYFPGEFGVRLEDNIVVTESGCEVLGNQLARAIDKPFG